MSENLEPVYRFPRYLKDRRFHYCPGCSHGVIHRLVAECLEELGVGERAYGIASIGCSCFLYHYLDVDICEAPHGRACAAATGAKRARPELVVFTYQGDGDFAAIGLAESFHAASRGEKITVIMVNNTVYGMTGGQLSPTTLPGQQTTTTPWGRRPEHEGWPLRVAEMLAGIDGVAFAARVAVTTPKEVLRAKKALKKAFLAQIEGHGFGYVEFLGSCPTNWKLDPSAALKKVAEELTKTFPLGIFVERF